jgi:hypothetical protein
MNYPSCKGLSCNGGRRPRRENCNPPEMSCYHDDAEERRKGEADAMWLLIAIYAAGALALASLVYMLYEPLVEMARHFN